MFTIDFHNNTIYIRDIYSTDTLCTSSFANSIHDLRLKTYKVTNISDNTKGTTSILIY